MLHDSKKYYYLRTTFVQFTKMSLEQILQKIIGYVGADSIYQYLHDFYGCRENRNTLDKIE